MPKLLFNIDQFQCAHGQKCIDQNQVCDEIYQCQDHSDELDCRKQTDTCHHQCDNKSRCLPSTFLCDGERDCLDGTDEANCGRLTWFEWLSLLYFCCMSESECFLQIPQRIKRRKELKRKRERHPCMRHLKAWHPSSVNCTLNFARIKWNVSITLTSVMERWTALMALMRKIAP